MNPKAKIVSNAIIFSTAEKAADPIRNTTDGVHTLPANAEVFISEATVVSGRIVYKISAGRLVGYVMKKFVNIDGPKVITTVGAEVFEKNGKKLIDTDVMIQFDAPVWVMGNPEKLNPPGGEPDEFVHVQYWDDRGDLGDGYIRVSALNRLDA